MSNFKKYVFDLDGTLCSLTDGDYASALPFLNRIAKVNKLYDEGHEIIVYTARGMGRFSNNSASAKENFEDLTRDQLEDWGVRYHLLMLGKPSGDFYIDDKGLSDISFFE